MRFWVKKFTGKKPANDADSDVKNAWMIIQGNDSDDKKIERLEKMFVTVFWSWGALEKVHHLDAKLSEAGVVSDDTFFAKSSGSKTTTEKPSNGLKPSKGLKHKLRTLLHRKADAASIAAGSKFLGVNPKLLHNARFGMHLDKLESAVTAATAGAVKDLMSAWCTAEKALQAVPYNDQVARAAVDAVDTLL